LQFNHEFNFAQPGDSTISWEAPLEIGPSPDNLDTAEAVRQELGLMGWPLPWNLEREDSGNLRFDVERPGKSYTVRALFDVKLARVEERRKGFWAVVQSLHAMMEVPNSRFAGYWGYYTEFCAWAVTFAALSGVYLWAVSRREKRAGGWTLTCALCASIGLMLYVLLRG
jgi:uncharacterized iron-regulated membrane protein